MLKIFAEYRVDETYRVDYMRWVRELQALYPHVQVFEGVQQAGLFVEEWTVSDEAEFESLKQARLAADHPFWSRLNACLVGEQKKQNIWLFRLIGTDTSS